MRDRKADRTIAMQTVSSRGRVVIPLGLRRKYHLEPGTCVCTVDYGGVLSPMAALDEPIEQVDATLKGSASLTHASAAERQ